MTHATLRDWKDRLPRPTVIVAWVVLVGVFLYTYAGPITLLVRRWYLHSDHYGHGFLVVPFALLLLWLRRDMVDFQSWNGSWWGVPFLMVWISMRWASAYFMFQTLDPPSMIPLLAGVTVLIGGWRALHWAWPSIFFLVFMMPLPGFLATELSLPLQRVGAKISTYLIQTLGIPAVAQGSVIQLEAGSLDVAEACSGLRMLMLFFAICVGATFVLDCQPGNDGPDARSFWFFGLGGLIRFLIHARIVPQDDNLWKKIVIIASAIPIAIVANVIRLTLTAVFYYTVNPEFGAKAGHTLAGLLMMPLALLLLWGEMAFLSRLLLEPIEKSLLSVSLARKLRGDSS